MSSKKTLQLNQLKQLTLEQIEFYKAEAIKRKAELEALKAKGNKAWSDELQDEFDELAIFLVDVDDIIEDKKASAEKTEYTVPEGEENLVHLSIVSGRRFNPNTGKEESKPVIQKFTYGEYVAFKDNHALLGYTIVNVLHNPYN